MPSILNLKFKGNKSFIAFSNLGDADALTKTWKVCTKVASFLEQGQRLENLSWRLWHLQNLMVDVDSAKSKREFKRLSKTMSDKLDKEKGRSIEELEAPGFKRNHSTDIIRQRAAEKERSREANLNGRPGTIKRMQFTFSVDQPTSTASAVTVQKPDLKPSAEFKDTVTRRTRPITRSTATQEDTQPDSSSIPSDSLNDKDTHHTHHECNDVDTAIATSSACPHDAFLRFPSLFSTDFGPSALLFPTPTVTNPMNYGEGVRHSGPTSDSFDIIRPTIELPLDELLMETGDCSEAWPIHSYSSVANTDSQPHATDSDMRMKSEAFEHQHPAFSQAHFARRASQQEQTVSPAKLGHSSETPPGPSSSRPTLSVRTQGATTRSSGPGASVTNVPPTLPPSGANGNNAPGGVKAECSNCGATHTPLWRRGLNDELNCNACGLYCKLHKRPRPKSMRNNHGEGRSQAAPRQESSDIIAQCYNCHTTATPLWRKDDEGKTVCNACGLYFKLHGSARPISMKSDVIRKRSRHDARRSSSGSAGDGSGHSSETPSASPGASRRASPNGDADSCLSPTLAVDSNHCTFDDIDADPHHNGMTNNNGRGFGYVPPTQSELVGALGGSTAYTYPPLNLSNFPGSYHHDLQSQLYSADYTTSSGDTSEGENCLEIRVAKRRRMSDDSATEPPSSAVSFSSFGDGSGFSTSSATSAGSARHSMEFSFSGSSSSPSNGCGSPNMNNGCCNVPNGNSNSGAGGYYSSYWHPPMLPQPHGSPFIHPPMLLPGSATENDAQMDFLHGPTGMSEGDHFLNPYIHPPMMLPEPHPPMLPSDWSGYPTDGVGGGANGY